MKEEPVLEESVLEESALDESDQPHKPQFESAPGQARKAATVEDAWAAAAELKPMVGKVRRLARERRAAIAKRGNMALPPDKRGIG
ncbi:MAG TPA: hypothetical protein VKA14_04015 [Gammaproteobacteria bacterium]|nr:hypothetical protein [Gammaproteobacteria bacterium]